MAVELVAAGVPFAEQGGHPLSPDGVAPAVVALLSDATATVTGRISRFEGRMLGRYEPEALTVLTEALPAAGDRAGRSPAFSGATTGIDGEED
jgi:hypothetical protein